MHKRRNLKLSLSYLQCAIAVSLSVAVFQFAAAAEKTEAPPVDTNPMDEDLNTQFTAPTATLGLQATFDTANSHNKQLIAARYNLPIAKAAITIAGAVPNPRFNLQYGFGPAFKLILAGNPQQFGWQEQIRTAGKRTKQLNVARANYTLAEFNLAAALFDVHNRVRRAYSELAAAEAYASLVDAEKKVAGELVNIAQKRYDNGKAAQSELLQAQLAASQLDTQAFQAQTRLQTASSLLAQMLGQTPKAISLIDVTDNGLFKLSAAKTEIVPSVEQNLPKLAELLPTGYSERPDLKVAIQQAFSDRRALSLARAQRIPDLFIDSGYQFTTFTPVQPFNLSKSLVPYQQGVYLNVTVETPIFYQHQGETTQAKETWLQDYEQIDQAKWQVAKDIVTAYESVAVARANIIKFKEQVVPEATEVARLARLRYQLGKSDLGTAIVAQQQYQQTLSSYFDSVVAYQNAWADLEKAVGVPIVL